MPINVNQISGANTAGTAADGGGGGVAWTSPSNAKVEDGVLASCGVIGPGGGGGVPNQLKATNFGFSIPSNAVIDGIKLEAKVQGPANDAFGGGAGVFLLYNGGASSYANTPNSGQSWPASLTWLTYGSSSSLWGRTWTAAEVNHANFGASLSASLGSGTGAVYIDSVKITVYWHFSTDVAAADVPKRYLYKVYSNTGAYLGNLPTPKNEFNYPQEINSAGSSIVIEVPLSPDTSVDESGYLLTEDSDYINTEASQRIKVESAGVIALGTASNSSLIQNGNRIYVYEYGYYWPNGKLMFSGQVNRIEASFGGDEEDAIKLLVLSDGIDMDNLIARGSPFSYTLDVDGAAQNGTVNVSADGGKLASWNKYGQTFVVGAGVTKLGQIGIALIGAATVTVGVYSAPDGTLLGSSTQVVDTLGAGLEIKFAFANLITVVPGNTYFFAVSVDAGQSIPLYISSLNPYANGSAYNSNYGGGSGGGSFGILSGYDLWFKTYSGVATTTATYTSKDPSTEMLKPIIDDYVLRGGLINYSSSSITATGLSLTVTFNTDTILDAIKRILSVSPSNFYWYVDLSTNTLYFKAVSTTPDFTLVKGRDLQSINLVMSIENVKNKLLFSGGPTAGVNLYSEYTDQTSTDAFGVRLDRKSDNRVTVQATANAIGSSFINQFKNENYETQVTVLGTQMDLTLLKPGKTVGLRGFGTFIERIVLQIVRIDYHPEYAILTLGMIPIRQSDQIEQITRGLLAEQTVANPSAPS